MASANIPQPSNFGRAWKITLQSQAAGGTLLLSSSQYTQALRTIFRISTRALLAYWSAEVTVYNPNAQTLKQIQSTGVQVNDLYQFNSDINSGDILAISAGYNANGSFNPDANKIYAGSVFQSLWTREDVTDLRVTLRCVQGLMQDAWNKIGSEDSPSGITLSAGTTPLQAVQQICAASGDGIPIEQIDEESQAILSQSQFSRAKTYCGRPFDSIQQITKDNDLLSWVSDVGLNIRRLNFDQNTTASIAYGPPNLGSTGQQLTSDGVVKRTLIGTPEQTQEGVVFRVLLDAQPKIGQIVQILPGTSINRAALQFGQLPASRLDQRGLYAIVGIDHFGDSRGGEDSWYTEITGVTSSFFPQFALSSPNVVN